MLDAVLRETLAAAGVGDDLSPEEMAGLVEVARRHAGQPLQLDPIVIDLVESILRRRFGRLGGDAAFWRNVAAEAAAALVDAPASQARLEQLWKQLGELAR